MLHAARFGNGDETPLVIGHGLFGSSRNWTAISKRLSAERPVIAVDHRNHGASGWSPEHSYPDMARDLAEIIQDSGGMCDVLGHSMGGKAAMVLALSYPEIVRKLIVVDIAPVLYTHTQANLIAAMQNLDLGAISTRRDADALLAETISEPDVRAFLLQSLDLKGDVPRWVLNLQALNANMANIMAFPKVDTRFDGPTLVLTGGRSDYVQACHHAPFRAAFPRVEFSKIDGASHWVHADKSREFIDKVRSFLAN